MKAVPIVAIPRAIMFAFPQYTRVLPTKGEHIMTATEYRANMIPIISPETPFSLNSRGRKGAISAYALFDMRVQIRIHTNFPSIIFINSKNPV